MKSGNLIKAGAVAGMRTAPAGGNAGVGAGAPRAAKPVPTEQHEHQPEIRLHREGDDIVAVEVVCGCGRTTFIECQYKS